MWLYVGKKRSIEGNVNEQSASTPPNCSEEKVEKNEFILMRRKHLFCLKWKDTRDVFALQNSLLCLYLIFSFCLVPASYYRLPLCQILCFLVHSWGFCYCYLVFTIYILLLLSRFLLQLIYFYYCLWQNVINFVTYDICIMYLILALSWNLSFF